MDPLSIRLPYYHLDHRQSLEVVKARTVSGEGFGEAPSIISQEQCSSGDISGVDGRFQFLTSTPSQSHTLIV